LRSLDIDGYGERSLARRHGEAPLAFAYLLLFVQGGRVIL